MSTDREDTFTEKVKQGLDQHADALDELTVARLRAIRKTALVEHERRGFNWLPATGLTAVAAVLVTVLVWNHVAVDSNGLPGDAELLSQMENLELLEELEFYDWLEATQSSS
jgi:hypothetical protein